ncbi:MAG: ATP-binding cassette domain-containing protein [Planctomycetota bacterium]
MLVVEGLSKTYGRDGVRALTEVDLTIDNGMFGLLGPNGAGKSTLMRTLATLQQPTSGTATLDGIDLLGEPMRAREVIGYLPQDAGVHPRVTAWEMLDYLAGLRCIGPGRRRREVIGEQLERVNLADVAHRRLDTYSGGMRQRFGIATVFLIQPRLVIVDEPTAGLDPTERRRFQTMLAEAAEGCVLLISSHIVEDVAGLCSQMALLEEGQIKLQGDPGLLVAGLAGKVWSRHVGLEAIDEAQAKYRLLSWRPDSGELLLRAFGDDLRAEGFEPAEPDLEDLYNLYIGDPTASEQSKLEGSTA